MDLKENRYKNIMKKMSATIEEYEEIVNKCKNLMKITEMNFEDLGKEFDLSKATIERTFNQVSSESLNLSLISRITKIYNFLLNKSEEQIKGKYKGLTSLLEEKRLKFDKVIEIGPRFPNSLEKLTQRKLEIDENIALFSNKELAQNALNEANTQENFSKYIIYFEKLSEIPRLIIGAIVPKYFTFFNEKAQKKKIYQIAYSNSINKFLLLETIAIQDENNQIIKNQIIEFNYNEFNYLSDLLGEIRKYLELTSENGKELNFLIEELKDYFGEKYK